MSSQLEMNEPREENLLDFEMPAFDLTSSFFPDLQISQPDGEKYLVFFLGGKFFAVPTKNVAEATAALNVTALPNAPEWLLGIANLRGEIISVVNLPAIFETPAAKPVSKSKFIVLHSQIFKFGVAFIADKLNEIAALTEEEIQFHQNENAPYFFGKAVRGGNALHLIDTEKLLASLAV